MYAACSSLTSMFIIDEMSYTSHAAVVVVREWQGRGAVHVHGHVISFMNDDDDDDMPGLIEMSDADSDEDVD